MTRPARPKYYRPERGDRFIRLRDIGPEHAGRIFEARNQNDGTGIIGPLAELTRYVLPKEAVGLRFVGETLGIFDGPDAMLLLKPEGYRLPESPADVAP